MPRLLLSPIDRPKTLLSSLPEISLVRVLDLTLSTDAPPHEESQVTLPARFHAQDPEERLNPRDPIIVVFVTHFVCEQRFPAHFLARKDPEKSEPREREANPAEVD